MAVSRGRAVALAVLAGVAWWAYQRRETLAGWGELLSSEDGGIVAKLADMTAAAASDAGAFLRLSLMKTPEPDLMAHRNVKAVLHLIRHGEGTLGENGYRTLFGGGLFSGWADHPRVLVQKSGHSSTAAGAYQFKSSTWDETKKKMGLPDFSPWSQDMGAIGRIMARGALQDVLDGRIVAVLSKISYEWASLPPLRYSKQGKLTIPQAVEIYRKAGGVVAQ